MQQLGVQAHPKKFYFVEYSGKIPEISAKFKKIQESPKHFGHRCFDIKWDSMKYVWISLFSPKQNGSMRQKVAPNEIKNGTCMK